MATDVVMHLAEIDWMPDDSKEFARLAEQRQLHKAEEDRHKRLREDLDKHIDAMILIASPDPENPVKIMVDNVIWQHVGSSSASKLDSKKLLELGVSASIIQQATVAGKPYSYVLATERE